MTDHAVSFFVPGEPAPKGSFRVVTRNRFGVPLSRPMIRKDSDKTYTWERVVARHAAAEMCGKQMFDGVPLHLSVSFFVGRPKSHYGRGRNGHRLKPSAPERPIGAPDWDKLSRSTADAMQGIVYRDDASIVQATVSKWYAEVGATPGAQITVRRAQW